MMSYELVPTLKDRALTKVAVAIWNQDNLKTLASCELYLRNQFKRAEVNARAKVAKLLLPNPLSKELLNIINVIGVELQAWVQVHGRLGNFLGTDSPSVSKFEFRWTSYGTVDKKKTAEGIIQDENVDTLTRYKYACAYCLESFIPDLWTKLDSSSRRVIIRSLRVEIEQGSDDLFPETSIHKDQALLFWSFIMCNKTNLPTSDNNNVCFPDAQSIASFRYPCQGAILGGNEIALKYFMQKLIPEERERFIVRAAHCVAELANFKFSKLQCSCKLYYSNVLCFLLSLMNETQQTEIFEKHAYEVLYCLLEWPWQEFFISTAERMWEYLSPKSFSFLLCQLINPDLLTVSTNYNYQYIFKKFWEQSPPSHKKFVLDGSINEIFHYLLEDGQEQNILMMMGHATPEQRKRILCLSRSLCCSLIKREKVNFLKLYLQQCMSTNDESKFAELNRRLVLFSSMDMTAKQIEKEKLSQFVFDFISSACKRRLPEGEIPVKRICGLNLD